jgi:starch-binding outer membrane protein SusE/F
MKNILFLTCTILLLVACDKDVEITTMKQPGVPPALTATPTTLVLSAATANDTVLTFSWQPSDYGFSAAVRYTVQIAKGGTNFAAPRQISMGSSLNLKYTAADLNQLALILGLPHSSAGQLDVRVLSSVSDSLPAIESNKITVNVTPYQVIINYPSLWVPGDYQGWDPATAPKISSKAANGIYEGYVNLNPGGNLKFKYTSHPDWNHTNYGWASSTITGNDVSGTFNTTGGDLFVPSAGYYLLKGNTNNNTWSGTKILSWSLIGDFNNWAGDAAMTYDATTKVWTGTINPAAAGKFKFRANNDWAINFGDNGADLGLDYGGADINITPGPKTIRMNLSVPGNYSYTIQ